MGSLPGYAKGAAPFLQSIDRYNAAHYEALDRQWNAGPRWRRLLYLWGRKKYWDRWRFKFEIQLNNFMPDGPWNADYRKSENK